MKSSKHVETCFVRANNDFDDKLTAFRMKKKNLDKNLQKRTLCNVGLTVLICILCLVFCNFVQWRYSWAIISLKNSKHFCFLSHFCFCLLELFEYCSSHQLNNAVTILKLFCFKFQDKINCWFVMTALDNRPVHVLFIQILSGIHSDFIQKSG